MSGLHPLERQWVILRTLAARRFGATVRELADEHNVSQKTIRRDLILLQSLGFPISPQPGPHGRNHWHAPHDASTPPLTFDISELLALYLGRTLLNPLAGTVVWDAAHSAHRKIKATLPESALNYLDSLSACLHRTSFRDSRYDDKAQLIDDLMVAIEDRRITFITYHSARSTEPLTYDVYPYGLVWHRASLYLVAHSQQHEEIRTFKLDRIQAAALETLKFQRPADFNLQDYLQHTLGIYHDDAPPRTVIIRFAPEVARYVQEHHRHHTQKLTPQPDGWLQAEFQLASLQEIKSWILSFGSKARVEKPEDLRTEIQHEAHEMLKQSDRSAADQRSAHPPSPSNL